MYKRTSSANIYFTYSGLSGIKSNKYSVNKILHLIEFQKCQGTHKSEFVSQC